MTVLACDVEPPPHEWEQSVQSVHAETTQSTAHSCTLHGWSSDSGGQTAPPNAICCRTVLMRAWVPVPHAAVHVLQSPQSETRQETLQLAIWQLCESWMIGHAEPPQTGETRIKRERIERPPSQVLLQSLHALHAETEQSTFIDCAHGGQTWVLQASESITSSHARPAPSGSDWIVRVLLVTPPSQASEHTPKVDHSVITQSTAQIPSLHTSVTESDVLHATPLCAEGVRTVRTFV